MGPTKYNPHFVNGPNCNVVTNLSMFMLLGFMFFDIHHKIYKNSWYPCEKWATIPYMKKFPNGNVCKKVTTVHSFLQLSEDGNYLL